jgi:hypothetical protein
MPNTEALIEKIRALPERALVRAARTASVEAFAKIWDNPEDDIYDAA